MDSRRTHRLGTNTNIIQHYIDLMAQRFSIKDLGTLSYFLGIEIVYLGRHPISWSSKKQRTIARSSTEAEYRSVAATTSELNWICSLLTKLGITLPTPHVIYCDNVGATYLCSNSVFHSRMKHVALDYHFIRGQVQSGALRVTYVSSTDQLADALTKSLPRSRFQDLRVKIGVSSRTPS
ncbi:RNA-binding KH domain-containing protein [Hibiscus syriacus]|uniref:RNA-binding KH domain-containing protein n=1 Tax=Hibiscus syriacus TaxID=106335 RepID=A0A6A2ZIM6_HIBSY|nr:RNA-binding KH domain-containing protein [Hibiscus syriacus]